MQVGGTVGRGKAGQSGNQWARWATRKVRAWVARGREVGGWGQSEVGLGGRG